MHGHGSMEDLLWKLMLLFLMIKHLGMGASNLRPPPKKLREVSLEQRSVIVNCYMITIVYSRSVSH